MDIIQKAFEKAVSYLNDEDDLDQIFVLDEERHWVNQGILMPKGSIMISFSYFMEDDKYHKATVEELQDICKDKHNAELILKWYEELEDESGII